MKVIWSPRAKESLKRAVGYVLLSFNKLIFYVKNDTIRIVAFWDTRREPKALIKDLEDQEKFGEP